MNLKTFALLVGASLSLIPSNIYGFLFGSHTFHPRCRERHLVLRLSAESLPAAYLVGIEDTENGDFTQDLRNALIEQGFGTVIIDDGEDNSSAYRYKYSIATGMLQLVGSPSAVQSSTGDRRQSQLAFEPPRWVSIVRNMENVLVANGWSFLDPDESEPMSPFDVDAANQEGTYKPKWGEQQIQDGSTGSDSSYNKLSVLGYDLTVMTAEQVLEEASTTLSGDHDDLTRRCLLEGATDPPNLKKTHNCFSFSGAAGQSDIPNGVFVCAVGALPLFSSLDLSPTTASSGWLSFSRPISEDHVRLIRPDPDSLDQRVEVVCAKSHCHLGHYFGPGEGYCINASCLNFIGKIDSNQLMDSVNSSRAAMIAPVSWRLFDKLSSDFRQHQLRGLLIDCGIVRSDTVALGAGCFWHVEAALRRLPGVINTRVGFAGGTMLNPTYEQVSHGGTSHAEVVLVDYDPTTLDTRILIDTFLALHDPTKVRAHGKHAAGTGQYRSCIFLTDSSKHGIVQTALQDCQSQLEKEIITEVYIVPRENDGHLRWFWEAEDRHQRHQERRNNRLETTCDTDDSSTLSLADWLHQYGKRKASRLGSAETINFGIE